MKLTMRQMCEHIVKADILKDQHGIKPTAKEIFNYSPTGELSEIWIWYNIACKKIGKPQIETES